jgi:hypothetical protein
MWLSYHDTIALHDNLTISDPVWNEGNENAGTKRNTRMTGYANSKTKKWYKNRYLVRMNTNIGIAVGVMEKTKINTCVFFSL